jgi:IS5 family transposase
VEIAQENKIAAGRKMRVDTTVVETDIHYPTDSSLLGDGVRVLTRIMKKVTAVAGKAGTRMRDRGRSAKLKVLAIARASRNKTEQGRQKMKNAYLKLLEITSRVAGQAKKFSREIAGRIKRGNLSVLHKAKQQLDAMVPRVQQVLRQTRERVLRGNTQADGKLLSLFETHTEVIRKGKAHKPNEFGKLVLIQEAENQIVTHYQVCEQRPADSTLLEGCLEHHVEQFGRAPERVAADPDSFQPLTNPRPSKWESAGSRFRATTPRAPHANSGRSSVGLRSFRSGAPAVKAASVFSNAGMGCVDRSTKGRTASSAGSDLG